MGCKITELRDREVINICDGSRLGYISDVEILTPGGQAVSIVVPGPCRFFGLFGRADDYIIPWSCIRKFGDDIILVELGQETIRTPRPHRRFF